MVIMGFLCNDTKDKLPALIEYQILAHKIFVYWLIYELLQL